MSLYIGETKIGRVIVDPEVVQGTDTTDATLSSNDQLPSGVSAYANGTKYIGTRPVDPTVTSRNGIVSIPGGFYTTHQTITVPTESEPITLQSKSTTPTTSSQTLLPDSGYDGLSSVTVAAIPSEYVVPTGTVSITSNGTVDVAAYASANVNVPTGGSPTLQSKSATPTESTQTITADSGYDGLSSVEVGAISSTYVGSGITSRSSSDLTASGATVSVPAGYYSAAASKAVASGTEGTPTATKGTVSNNAVTVTPSVTNTAGYITGGTKTGTGVSVAASELVSGTKSISSNGTEDVTNYAAVSVDIPVTANISDPWGFESNPVVDSNGITTLYNDAGTVNGNWTIYQYMSAKFLEQPTSPIDNCSYYLQYDGVDFIFDPSTVEWSIEDASTNLVHVEMGDPIGYEAGQGAFVAFDYYYGSSPYSRNLEEFYIWLYGLGWGDEKLTFFGAFNGGKVTATASASGATTDTKSLQLPVFGSLVVKPREVQQWFYTGDYYMVGDICVEAIDGNYVGDSISRRTSSDLTVSGATVTAPAGYYAAAASKSVASGSATTPATSITANPSISVDANGLITATASASQSVTPTVSAGYVSSGTAGTVTVSGSNTSQLSTQAAATITPTESSQTAVAAGKYTTGAVTVAAISPTYVGSGITQRDDTDLTASGATVTVPAGYYASQETKSITSGSVTVPSTISGSSATVSTGTNTLTLTKTVSVTPNVTTAGYISSGTTGNASVSLTASVTTKAAATITPGTSDQTIAAGTYLTGAQTISGDADLIASNIVSTANIFGVQGTVAIQHYYTGSSAPSSSLGANGDIYFQTSS